MDTKQKRKMLEILRGLIASGHDGNQNQICLYLNKKGFNVAQSTVSRALKKIGAIKVTSKNTVRYEIRSLPAQPRYSGFLKELMIDISANETQIVIKTSPGSASFLAGFIDHHCHRDSLGTVAGDDTILVVPRSVKTIALHLTNIKEFIEKSS